jgi:hypothetical protein
MSEITQVAENDVLIATALWLVNRGFVLKMCSPVKGQGINYRSDIKRLHDSLFHAGVSYRDLPEITSSGPDISGYSKDLSESWKVECKGSGKGRTTTQQFRSRAGECCFLL